MRCEYGSGSCGAMLSDVPDMSLSVRNGFGRHEALCVFAEDIHEVCRERARLS